eukprot:9430111-Pyramimonas_sp.AAC.1
MGREQKDGEPPPMVRPGLSRVLNQLLNKVEVETNKLLLGVQELSPRKGDSKEAEEHQDEETSPKLKVGKEPKHTWLRWSQVRMVLFQRGPKRNVYVLRERVA